MRAPDARLLLLALPALTASVLVVVLVGALAERSVRAARVYGGPTGVPGQGYRVELVDSFKGVQSSAPGGSLRVVARGRDGHGAAWSGLAGPDGVAEVALPALPPAKRYELSVVQGDATLAHGEIELAADSWLGSATRRGGWQTLRLDDATELELAPARGVLAVPFPAELLLRVRRNGEPVSAELELSAEGAGVEGGRRTSGEAPARFVLTPQAHGVVLGIRVFAGGPPREVRATLPVVPGAFDAVLDGERLLVTSPVPRDRAYFTLVTERRRVLGGSLRLAGNGQGEVRLPALPDEPLWAVVASSPDLLSAARVGFPIGKHAEPARTLDMPERLLLDGLPRALSRESARRKKVRFVAVAVCALSLLLGVLLLAARARSSALALTRHFEASGLGAEDRRALTSQRPLWLTTALCAVGLGFVALLIFALVLDR